MTDKQPEALRLADVAQRFGLGEDVAVELRRLHESEHEGWRYANELEQDRKRLHEVNAELVEALTYLRFFMTDPILVTVAIKALAKVEGK